MSVSYTGGTFGQYFTLWKLEKKKHHQICCLLLSGGKEFNRVIEALKIFINEQLNLQLFC